MKKRSFWIKLTFSILIVYFIAFRPIAYYIEGPGAAFELEEMIKVDGKYDDTPGSFLMTTVGVMQATPLTSLFQFHPDYDGVSEENMLSGTQDLEAYAALQQFFMNNSINSALNVAFEAAGKEVEFENQGIYVMNVIPESNFYEKLQPGDLITRVDGLEFENSQELIDYVSNLAVGVDVAIEFQRSGEKQTVSGEMITLPDTNEPGIGIGLIDNTAIKTDPEVEINSGEVGGPSAGLMFSLQIYSELMDDDLLKGHRIAGTGTIASDGTVGRIGGIDKKVVTADDEDAAYFLAPDDEIDPEIVEAYPEVQTNYEEAAEKVETMNTDMEVVPVRTFQEAVEFLNSLEPRK